MGLNTSPYRTTITDTQMIREDGLIAAYEGKIVNGKVINLAAASSANLNNPASLDMTVVSLSQSVDKTSGSVIPANSRGYLKAVSQPNVISILSPFTICLTYQGTFTQNFTSLFSFGRSATNRGAIACNAGNIGVTLNNGGNIGIASSTSALLNTNNNPTTIIYTWDGSTVGTLYINGILQIGTSAILSTSNTSTMEWALMCRVSLANIMTAGKFVNAKIYNRVLTSKEITKYHNDNVQCIFNECFCNYPINATKLNNWRFLTGSGIINQATSNSGILKKGNNYLEFTNATLDWITIPVANGSGTYEFSFNKKTDDSQISLNLFSNSDMPAANISGYQFAFTSGEIFTTIRFLSGAVSNLNSTRSSYISLNTWYSFRVTKSITGVFTFYIIGGVFTNWTLIDTTGGTGTNPVINTNVTSHDNIHIVTNGLDLITNIKVYNGIKI